MVASRSSAVQTVLQPHLHMPGQQCPFCEQDIPPERLEEINGRIAARERERFAEATARLRDQLARERAQADAKAKAELEQTRRQAAADLQRITAEAAAHEKVVREEATKTAEEAAKTHFEEAERVRNEAEAALQARIDEAEAAKAAAEQTKTDLSAQLEQVRADSAAAMQKAGEDAAARETAIRADAVKAAEHALQERIAAAEAAKNAAEEARQNAETELRDRLAATGEEIQSLKEAHASEIHVQREALEKDKQTAVLMEQAKTFDERQRLQVTVQDLQRQLAKERSDVLGEGAELELLEELKAAFERDRIRRVPKGTPGADIVHEIVENGQLCGKIVYDSKKRNSWKSEYVTKLCEDKIAEGAQHAVLSLLKFPADAKHLAVRDGVILANPARVTVIAEILRADIVQAHGLRVSNHEREEKTAELYAYINSERFRQHLDSIEAHTDKLLDMDVAEQRAHRLVWERRGGFMKALQKAHGNLRADVARILGTFDPMQ